MILFIGITSYLDRHKAYWSLRVVFSYSLSTLETIVADFVAEFDDYSRQCGQGFRLVMV